jgi:hypothetical protein
MPVEEQCWLRQFSTIGVTIVGLTIKFTNSPPCACHGSSGQKPQYGLITLAYQRFTAVLLLIYGSLFLSGVCDCLNVFWWAIARVLELELDQRTNIKFLVKLGKSGSEIGEILVQVHGDFFLFPKIKEILKGRHFDDIDDIRSSTMAALKAIPQNQFQNCFEG